MAQRGVNKVILVGNCGQDPETKYLPSGSAVTNLSVATSEVWKDKQTGQSQERTEWHRVVFFNRLAEIAGEYLRKGSKVYIEGSLRTRKWQDQSGQDRYSTEIVGSEMQMLDSRGSGADMGNRSNNQGMYGNTGPSPQPSPPPQHAFQQGQQRPQQPPPQHAHAQAPPSYASQQPPAASEPPAQGFDSFDDDIPF